ncbi:unnamed protein product [Cochlearia groenlandica]
MCAMVSSGQKMGQVMARSHLLLSRRNFSDCLIRCQGSRVSKTLKMESQSKRPTCPFCSKPTQLCLCKRLRSPCLDNQVSVTILQHSLERKHALNTTRIAKIGLKNVTVTTVFDVHSEAEFFIREIGIDCDDSVEDCVPLESEKNVVLVGHGSLGVDESLNLSQHSCEDSCRDSRVLDEIGSCEEGLIRISMKTRGVISDISHSLMVENRGESSSFDDIMASPIAMDVLAKGFVVTKFNEGIREFELEVPPGSALLFPSEESVMINGLKERDLKVKNLIVLDGTWSKARRMYLENPWLKLLCCHVKLEIEGASLYKKVRRQPRAGCLSTVESIVYAMKEIDEDHEEGLDNMLDVFESMVQDQRRFRDENFVKIL